VNTTTLTRQVAFLRGINVGRNKRVAMAQLRQLLQDLGYTDVTTHLNSGNAIFTSPLAPTANGSAIEQALIEVLGVEAKVVVRSHAELAAAVDANPLRAVAVDPAKHLVGFLSAVPDVERQSALNALNAGSDATADQCRIVGNHLYLWCPRGVLDSVFSTINWDRRIGVTTTMRNWNTVTKLVELSGG
jgi:uncharacterized protein (DUF1697 family)